MSTPANGGSAERAGARPRLALVCLLASVFAIPGAFGQEGRSATISDEVRTFCGNIADAARDQRYMIQKGQLEELQAEVDKRIAELEKRRTEYEEWLSLRNNFLKKAEENLVDIYKNMKSDAAAAQLELIDVQVAAAIIMKLSPRLASSILNEMDAKKAAKLAGIIASAVDRTVSGSRT